jgi:hypothetical protein
MVPMRSRAPTRGVDRVIDLLDQPFLVGRQSLRFVRWRKIRAWQTLVGGLGGLARNLGLHGLQGLAAMFKTA